MPHEKKLVHQSNPYSRNVGNKKDDNRNIYWGEVVSIDDDTDGGRIKVRIPNIDNRTVNDNLPFAYPMLPKFFHLYPKVGETVRIFIEDTKFPQRSRYWMGSVVSQLQKVNFDPMFTALSTTNLKYTEPERAISTYPDAKGVFPDKESVALIGRDNTDVILSVRDVEIRAGKHEHKDVFTLNKKNPSSLKLSYDLTGETTISNSVIMADRIALISHDGIPKFKSTNITQQERDRIFSNGHPIGRADLIVEAFELIKSVLKEHVHNYSGVPADASGALAELDKIDFTKILQKNIVIN